MRKQGTKSAELITAIKTTAVVGTGTEEDPVRTIVQYWDLDGVLLVEHDPERDRMVI